MPKPKDKNETQKKEPVVPPMDMVVGYQPLRVIAMGTAIILKSVLLIGDIPIIENPCMQVQERRKTNGIILIFGAIFAFCPCKIEIRSCFGNLLVVIDVTIIFPVIFCLGVIIDM